MSPAINAFKGAVCMSIVYLTASDMAHMSIQEIENVTEAHIQAVTEKYLRLASLRKELDTQMLDRYDTAIGAVQDLLDCFGPEAAGSTTLGDPGLFHNGDPRRSRVNNTNTNYGTKHGFINGVSKDFILERLANAALHDLNFTFTGLDVGGGLYSETEDTLSADSANSVTVFTTKDTLVALKNALEQGKSAYSTQSEARMTAINLANNFVTLSYQRQSNHNKRWGDTLQSIVNAF
jgi:hypothetical protein